VRRCAYASVKEDKDIACLSDIALDSILIFVREMLVDEEVVMSHNNTFTTSRMEISEGRTSLKCN
jgi:hypothetical protein